MPSPFSFYLAFHSFFHHLLADTSALCSLFGLLRLFLGVCVPKDDGPWVSWLEDGWTAGVSGRLTAVSRTAEGVAGLLVGVSGVLEDGLPLSHGLVSAELESSRFTDVTLVLSLKTLSNNTKYIWKLR